MKCSLSTSSLSILKFEYLLLKYNESLYQRAKILINREDQEGDNPILRTYKTLLLEKQQIIEVNIQKKENQIFSHFVQDEQLINLIRSNKLVDRENMNKFYLQLQS